MKKEAGNIVSREGSPVPEGEHEKSSDGFVDIVRARCRVVAGRVFCKLGNHNYEETGREVFHGGEDEVIHLKCKRPDCGQTGWTEWHRGTRII